MQSENKDDTYFFNMLIKSMKQDININMVCKRYHKPVQLLLSLTDDWTGIDVRINDSYLIDALNYLLYGRAIIINQSSLRGDFLIIYNRCKESYGKIKKNWEKGLGLNYDAAFELIIELCWLFASLEYSEREKKNRIALLSNKVQLCNSISGYLERIYVAAGENDKKAACITEGIAARRSRRAAGSYSFRCEESKEFFYSDYTDDELIKLKEGYEHYRNLYLTIYYALTITSGLAYSIMGGQ